MAIGSGVCFFLPFFCAAEIPGGCRFLWFGRFLIIRGKCIRAPKMVMIAAREYAESFPTGSALSCALGLCNLGAECILSVFFRRVHFVGFANDFSHRS